MRTKDHRVIRYGWDMFSYIYITVLIIYIVLCYSVSTIFLLYIVLYMIK